MGNSANCWDKSSLRNIEDNQKNEVDIIYELPYENFKQQGRVVAIVRQLPFKFILCKISNLNKEMEFATIEYEDGSIYKGDVEHENQRSGQGRLKFQNGDIYEGEFRVGYNVKMVLFMKVNGRMGIHKVKEKNHGKMAHFTRDNTKMVQNMAKENISGLIVVGMKVNGQKDKQKVMEK